jgi:hypothetical protein
MRGRSFATKRLRMTDFGCFASDNELDEYPG